MLVVLLSATPGRTARAGGKMIEGVVNLNTAPPATLAMLPGIGPAKVQQILDYRQRRPFRTVDELVRIKGIGSKMVKRLRPHLAVTGPSTARALTAQEAKAVKESKESKAALAATATVAATAAVPVPAKSDRGGAGVAPLKDAPAIKGTVPRPPPGVRSTRRWDNPERGNLCLPPR